MDSFKVFVNVPHQRLLLKLQQHGLESSILGWIECFLTQHSQRVVLEGVKSVEVLVTSGVPQGTVLGPLLSFIFINDIHYNTNSRMRLFADDCLIYRINSPVDCRELQKHLSLLCWLKEQFNKSKYYVLDVSRKRQPRRSMYHLQDTPVFARTQYQTCFHLSRV